MSEYDIFLSMIILLTAVALTVGYFCGLTNNMLNTVSSPYHLGIFTVMEKTPASNGSFYIHTDSGQAFILENANQYPSLHIGSIYAFMYKPGVYPTIVEIERV